MSDLTEEPRERDDDAPLFPVEPVRQLRKGDKVVLRTMWGEEACEVVRVHTEDGFPMVMLTSTSGDTISANVAAVKQIVGEDGSDGLGAARERWGL